MKNANEISLSEWLDRLTEDNRHSERCIVEAMIKNNESATIKAVLIWLLHMEYGYMPTKLLELRESVYKEIEDNED